MDSANPKHVRRLIMEILYAYYQENPLQMLSPADVMADGRVTRDTLGPSIYYLHERDLIELMVGYSPPLFDAARIAPDGIDLVEDAEALERMFPAATEGLEDFAVDAARLVLELADEAAQMSFDGYRRDWLLRDVRRLRDLLRQPPRRWRQADMAEVFRWIDEYFRGDASAHLNTLVELKKLVDDRLKSS